MKRSTTTTRAGGAKKPKTDEGNKLNSDANILCLEKKISIEERKQHLKDTMKKVKYDGYADYREAKNTAGMIIAKDQLLRQVDRQPTEECDSELAMAQARKVIFQIASTMHPEKNVKTDLNPIHNGKETNETMRNLLNTLREECTPPENRVLITPNITRSNNPVPVYCDLGKPLKATELPDTYFFDQITENKCDMNIHPQMKAFYDESQESSNHVSCNCEAVDTDSNGDICLCSKNNCPCARVNTNLQQNQKTGRYRKQHTEINTSSKLKISDFDDFYDTFGFNCSKACACKGRCNNNATYVLEQNIHRFELSRSGPKGFGVRTRTFIPAYTPVLEFIGEITRYESIIETKSQDYSLLLHDKEEAIVKLLKNHTGLNFSAKFKTLMKNVWKERPGKGIDYYINPKQKGNLGRFLSHSCLPNLAQVRIFTGSFTPAHMKLVLVSTQDIYPGEELTFNYGSAYIRDHLPNGGCLCGTIPCQANKDFDTFKDANFVTLRQYFQERHQEQYLKFEKYLIDGDDYIPKKIEEEYEEGSDSENGNIPKEQEDYEELASNSEVDDKQTEEFDVEKILEHQYTDNGIYYLVKWLDYPSSANSWQSERNMSCKKKLDEYWKSKKAKIIEERYRRSMKENTNVHASKKSKRHTRTSSIVSNEQPHENKEKEEEERDVRRSSSAECTEREKTRSPSRPRLFLRLNLKLVESVLSSSYEERTTENLEVSATPEVESDATDDDQRESDGILELEQPGDQVEICVEEHMDVNRSQLKLGREIEFVSRIGKRNGIRVALLKYVDYNVLEWLPTSYVGRVRPQAMLAFYEKCSIKG